MFWEIVVLTIAFIIFALDIIWQFYMAGIFGPNKARRLIIDDPLFKKLEETLSNLEQKVVTLESEMKNRSISGSGESSLVKSINYNLTQLSDKILSLTPEDIGNFDAKLRDMSEHLSGVINGCIGNLAKGYYEDMGMSDNIPADKDEDKLDREIANMQIKTQAQQQRYEFYYNILEPMMGEDRAHKMAVGVVLAPKWLKGVVKKNVVNRLKEYGGM